MLRAGAATAPYCRSEYTIYSARAYYDRAMAIGRPVFQSCPISLVQILRPFQQRYIVGINDVFTNALLEAFAIVYKVDNTQVYNDIVSTYVHTTVLIFIPY
jgi:hypothetical protein